jgi:acyl carrier protein
MDNLIKIFADVLNIDSTLLNDDSSPESISSWDSLAAMSLVTAIEDAFNVELTTSEIMKMRTIGFARAVLKTKGALT